MRFHRFLLLFGLGACVGCGGGSAPMESPPGQARQAKRGDEVKVKDDKVAAGAEQANADENPRKPAEDRPAPRKIIYTAQVDVTVEDFDHAQEQLTGLLKEHAAYVAHSQVQGYRGTPPSGNWTLRVPVERLDAFLEAVGKLGEVNRRTLDSDDVTDRFYDLQARLKTNQVEEEGLRKLYLDRSTGKLEELLAVRRELAVIRGTIEAQQGQLQRWDKETQFSTVHLNLASRRDFQPPPAADFGSQLGRTFSGSVENLFNFGRGLLLLIVALAPWLPLLVLLVLLSWYAIRANRPEPAKPSSAEGHSRRIGPGG